MNKKKIIYGSLIIGGIILLVILLIVFNSHRQNVLNECGFVDEWKCKIDWDDDEDIYDCWTEELGHVYVKPENVIVRYCDDEHMLALKKEMREGFFTPHIEEVYYLYIFIGLENEE